MTLNCLRSIALQLMNTSQLTAMICLMQSHGGSFVGAIAQALRFADPVNRQRLLDAFPDLVKKYGPTSDFMKPKQLTEV
jgi:2-oxo-4-hydroxy-4-carboxy--5-ureidoimidazoline (OHCU) decarboxylase